MKNLHFFLFLYLLSITIPIESKNSIVTAWKNFWQKYIQQEIITYQSYQACKIEANCPDASVTIESWKQSCIMIEVRKKGFPRFVENITVETYLHNGILQIETKRNKTKIQGSLDIHIFVPESTSIKVYTNDKNITCNAIYGAINASSNSGEIIINQGDHSIIAKTIDGNITINRPTIGDSYTINAYSRSGTILCNINPNAYLLLQAQTVYGSITSSLFVTLLPDAMLLNDSNFDQLRNNITGYTGQKTKQDDPATLILSTEYSPIILNGIQI